MRLTKSLLSGIAAFALATGTAFAGGSMSQSVEAGGPELLSDEAMPSAQDQALSFPQNGSEDAREAMASIERGDYDVIYIYPVEVTEYYLLVPSEPSELG